MSKFNTSELSAALGTIDPTTGDTATGAVRPTNRFDARVRLVDEALRRADKPLTAYQLIEELRDQDPGLRAPPVVYRALSRLIEEGRIHRLESQNAFLSCNDHCRPESRETRSEEAGLPILAVCQLCGDVRELAAPALLRLVHQETQRLGFQVAQMTLEMTGQCAACMDYEGALHVTDLNREHST